MRIFSGIQPTGEMHIGNYLGAVSQWLELQEKHECFFCVVDLHALTVPQDPDTLRKGTRAKVIELLAAGINPEKCTLFVQSHVPEHTELSWLLNTITPLGELERMTQFKDKSKKQKKEVYAGLLNYPVLMASDILLYQTEAVPVGQDQTQHLELARTLAKKFNARFGKTFREPETIIRKEAAKIMSLKDPRKKMSKSDAPESYLGLFEEPSLIQKKIAGAVTDTGKEVRYDAKKKPGVSNLLLIYSLFSKEPVKKVEAKFRKKGYAELKKSLAALLIASLEPLRRKKKELGAREVYVREILRQGQHRASLVAQSTLRDAKGRVGLLEA
ncbi:MAG: tryptophan--tRNA ligase [bacterium]|nr:tryptophan--tRNA ligase [bacterium]